MSSSSELFRWDIWLAKVYFEDQPEISKIRPVLIVDDYMIYVLVVKITSHKPRAGYDGEYRIVQWKEAGLCLFPGYF